MKRNNTNSDATLPTTPLDTPLPVYDSQFRSPNAQEEGVENRTSTNKINFLWWWVMVGFMLINVIILYILHFTDSSAASVEYQQPSSGAVKFQGQQQIPSDTFVSFNASGQLQVGAGTSIYLQAGEIVGSDPNYLHFAPPNVVSYQRQKEKSTKETETVIATFAVDDKNKKITMNKETILANKQVRGIVSMGAGGKYVFLQVEKFQHVSVVAGHVGKDGKIDITSNKVQQITTTSAANSIGKISESNFVVAYYDQYSTSNPYFQNLIAGQIAENGEIKLSKPIKFGYKNYKNEGLNLNVHTVFGDPLQLSAIKNGFMIPWFSNEIGKNKTGLCIGVGELNADSEIEMMAKPNCHKSVEPHHFVDSTLISKNIAAVVFYDKLNHFALTMMTIEFSSEKNVFFRNQVVVKKGGMYNTGGKGISPKPDIEVVGENRVAVSYLDPSNEGKPTLQVYELFGGGILKLVVPDMVFSTPEFNIGHEKGKYRSVVLDILGISSTSFVIGYTGKIHDGMSRFCLVETLDSPLGIIAGPEEPGKKKVVMTGTVKFSGKSLNPGKFYYTTTAGELYEHTNRLENHGSLALNKQVVVSKNSKIGRAIDENTLLLNLS